RRDPQGALAWLAKAEAAGPPDIDIRLHKGLALRLLGDLPGAIGAFDEALELDPYHFLALLSKGSVVERLAGERSAAVVYRHAMEVAPPFEKLDPSTRAAAERARTLVARTADALEAYLQDELIGQGGDCPPAARARFEEGLRVFAGKAKVYQQQPIDLHYPRLPAIPFYDRTLFPWLPKLEAATDMIRGELETALAEAGDRFVPYIAYPKGAPVNQWGELNHSRRWSSLFLWKDGARQEAACAQCPRTAALLDELPMADQPGFAPTAVFSALEARTHIPPHTGSANTRLLVHLPLILPGPARFRVGGEVRDWRMGEAWVFDDTIEHEAWNDADALRVILIFDIWNPFLDEAERALITAMMTARDAFFAG
ncbi:MAG: aspartyl/asparaginyl beta-hydroxylase domain-containing protein, partial [Phenylobacterium sp.]